MKRFAIGVVSALWAAGLSFVGAADLAGDLPFEGEVKGTNLNVRSGPGTNYTALGTLHKGERVTVVSRKDGWYKIQLPESCRLWVAKKYVEWKPGDAEGTVKGNDVNLRAAGSFNAESLVQLKDGSRLKVFGAEGDWLKVSASDADVFAWVSSKYVTDGGSSDPDTAEWLAIRKLHQAEMDKEVRSRNLDGVLARGEALAGSAKNPRVKERAELFVKQIREEAEWYRKLSATERERNEAVRAIQDKYKEEMRKLLEKTPESATYLLTGWLFECGNIIGGAPGSHKLVKGGKTIAYVRGNNVDLNKYYGQYVGVNGEDSFHPRYREPVIVIQSEAQIQSIGTGE